ncbi:MAG: cytochrome c [Saprospiraceae bacterium]|nr:cytochrome c [Saprospiraceae bacterium]
MIRSLFLLFGLVCLFITACGSPEDEIARRAAAARETGAVKTSPDGQAVFRKNCVTCHGADGALGLNGAKDLGQSTLTLEERVNIITNGKKLMTPFNAILSPAEIQAVAVYTQTLKK